MQTHDDDDDDDDDDADGCVLWINRKEVPPRGQSTKMEIMGLFVGARAVRGMDWSWSDQDGNIRIMTLLGLVFVLSLQIGL